MFCLKKLTFLLSLLLLSVCSYAGNHQIGIGAHYWQTLDDIDIGDIDEDGVSWLVSYQYRPTLLGLGLDVEAREFSFLGKDETLYEPQAYVILGGIIYVAGGVGGYYYDGEFAEDPFYFGRAGIDIQILMVHLDIHAIYRFEEWSNFDDAVDGIDTDTLSLGAAIRLEF